MVHRGKLTNREPAVAEHDSGERAVSHHRRTPRRWCLVPISSDGTSSCQPEDGQGGRTAGPGAKQIRNGVTYELKAGDVVIIPAGTGHLFTRIDDHITYLMVRFDPDKIVPLKTEADSKADLSTSGTETPEEAAAAGKKFAHLGRHYEPNCKMCPGTYIPATEINAYIKRGIANGLTDQGIRQVDIGRVNVGVAVVTRPKLATAEANVAEHDLVSELYHVIDGRRRSSSGRTRGQATEPCEPRDGRLRNGPGKNAKEIRNGVPYNIKEATSSSSPTARAPVHQNRRPHHVSDGRIDPDQGDAAQRPRPTRRRTAHRRRATAGGGAGAASAPGR